MTKVHLRLDKDNQQRLHKFFNTYTFEKNYNLERYNRKTRIGQKGKCRFCFKSSAKTTFRKSAHLIPELLGNKYLLSNFECDKCNELFSTFEDSLASYLGAFRTLYGMKSRRRTPKFKDDKGFNYIL